ncbi:MAG TPA: hypothetical protein DCQ06_02380 [Myxococcales bacterium]|nr:hypothetical protein [Myxococcales bacterium]
MQVLFSAALDNVPAMLSTCPCQDWLAAAQQWADQQPARRGKKAAQTAFPAVAMERAILAALEVALPLGDANDVPQPLGDFPISAWSTPDGVELAFSTLSRAVCEALAQTDEPVTVAKSVGGWRMPLHVFRFADRLQQVRVTTRTKMSWSDYVVLREHFLDLVADTRQPLLARLAEVAALSATVAAERALPTDVPELSARLFLSWRGFLEARVSAGAVQNLSATAMLLAPLYGDLLPLDNDEAVTSALADDWRQLLAQYVVPVERELAIAIEAYLGARLFNGPLLRYRTLVRGYVEVLEGFAVGLRYAAAIGGLQQRPVSPEQMVAALAMGEQVAAHGGQALPSFALPKLSHDRGPRMADLDMTLESIC